MINSSSQNLASQTRWIAVLPINMIFKDEPRSISINLTKFALPEISIGSTEYRYLGNYVEIPTKVIQPNDKTLEFNYLLSSDFYQYLMLYKWVKFIANNKTLNQNEKIVDAEKLINGTTFPISVFLLSEFKKPIFSIKYMDCWIKKFGEISLDYQSNDEPVIHSFTVAYSHFEFIDPSNTEFLV